MKQRRTVKIIILVCALLFSMTACKKDSDDPRPKKPEPMSEKTADDSDDPRPKNPEPMSEKTAMKYFRDERIKIGINMANTLDNVDFEAKNKIPTERLGSGIPASQELFNQYKAMGFDIIRITVSWLDYIGPAPDYKIDEAWLRRVAEVVNYARNANLKAFINIHQDSNNQDPVELTGAWLLLNEIKKDPSIADKFEKVWKNIAEYFVNYGDYLMFQNFNELFDESDFNSHGQYERVSAQNHNIINDLNQRFTNAVRSTGGNNANRYLIYNGYAAYPEIATNPNSHFKLPNDTATGRQIVGFAYWGNDFAWTATTPNWGAELEKDELDNLFSAFKKKFIDNNIPVIIGETTPLGYTKHAGNAGYNPEHRDIARQNRMNYVDYFYSRSGESEIVPCFYESGFKFPSTYFYPDCQLIDRKTGKPNSDESAEVIRRMVNAAKNPIPRSRIITSGSSVDYYSWYTKMYPEPKDGGTSTIGLLVNSSIIPGTSVNLPFVCYYGWYSAVTINGNITKPQLNSMIGWQAIPDPVTLEKLRKSTTISFKVKGDGRTYKIKLATSDIKDWCFYETTFPTRNGVETTVTVNVNNFSQPGWGVRKRFTRSLIQNIEFETIGGESGPVNLTIKDLVLN